MSRTHFATAEADIVVASDGYFDVYPPAGRTAHDKPLYRGLIAELGREMRGSDERLAVRPSSAALEAAIQEWSIEHGAAAVRGELGGGRDGKLLEPAKSAAKEPSEPKKKGKKG